MTPFPVDDENLYQSYMLDPYTGKTREFYATLEDTAVMLARNHQPHSLGHALVSHVNGEVIPLEGDLRSKVIKRAKELAESFGSIHPLD